MAFINDYLTEEEIERFRGYNLKYHKKCGKNHKILGTVKGINGVRCTIDRERKMYLFNCGDNAMIRRDTLEPIIYFALVIDGEKPYVAYITLYEKHGLVEEQGYSIFWKFLGIDNQGEYSDDIILQYTKEALSKHGLEGYPEEKPRLTKFDF